MEHILNRINAFRAEFFKLEGSVSNLKEIDFTQAATYTAALETLAFTQSRGNQPFWEGGPDDNFAARVSGDLLIETGGRYTFYLTSDDGSSFSIDGDPIINNDGLHAARVQTVTLDLSAGTIPFEVLYFERGGQQVLSLEWSGPDTAGARKFIGPEAVSHSLSNEHNADHVDPDHEMPAVEEETDHAGHEQETTAVSGFRAEFFKLEGSVSNLKEIDFTQAATYTAALETLAFTQSRGNQPFWEGGPDDNFAARVSGDLLIETGGRYTFYLTSDDGSSFSIDGDPIINNDGLHAARVQTVTLDLSAGTIPFEVLYFERGGQQVLSLEWSGPDTAGARKFIGPEAVSHSLSNEHNADHVDPDHEMPAVEEETDHAGHEQETTAVSGFRAEFFKLEGSVSNLKEIDFTQAATYTAALETLAFTQSRGNQPFWEGGPDDNFAARVSGDLLIETGGRYTFYLTSDDGSSFSIDGDPIINNDGLHAARVQTVTLDLSAGTIPFEVLYFERGGQQVLSLEWSGPDTAGARKFIGPEAVSHSLSNEHNADHVDPDHEMPAVEEETDHAGHEMDPVEEVHDHTGHGMDHGADPVALPQTKAEIDAFVAAVRSSPEVHSHDMGSSMAGEHMAAMDLVPRAEATHIAIGNGDWDNPANWHNGEVPGDDARVLIPEGVHIVYDHVSDARLFTLRVDGHLDFATDVDSQMIVDTIVITPSGALTIGTATDPVDPNVDVDIIFANNGAIDTDWDPMLLSRGMIAHGKVEIHGAEKDSHEKVIDDPRAGDTWLDFGETPEGWAVGDTIVIAGTHYDGYTSWDPSLGYSPSEDEVRVITQIEDGQIFFEKPLEFDHDSPREDLKTSVANYTRNVSFETENATTAEIFERGHVMFMHNDDVDVRYAEFHELGRTDKSETALNVGEFNSIEFDSNVKGRYAFHFHKAGVDDLEDPGIATGNAVFGSPGWGFVHHDSNAILDNNATYNTFGAGYVAETGNETGEWTDNIAIFAKGTSWKDPKLGNDLENFDLGSTGDGFWFQGRMVASVDNIAASVNNGFVYFHRGGFDEGENIKFDSAVSAIPGALDYGSSLSPNAHPILGFNGNEAFASKSGLYVLKDNAAQGHDVHSVLEDFTAWNVRVGVELSYTGHYTLKDFDLVGVVGEGVGIKLGANANDITIVNPEITDFRTGIDLFKGFTTNISPEAHDYNIINPSITNAMFEYKNYDPNLDDILSTSDLPFFKPDIALNGPLTYQEGDPAINPGARAISISGTKSDSLGQTDFSSDADDFSVNWTGTRDLLAEEGYYSTSGGQNYFLMDIFFSDRMTGDIYLEKHPVFLDANVPVGQEGHWAYGSVPFNGVQDLGGEDDPTIDSAILWATLTDGQIIFGESFYDDVFVI